MDVPASLPYRQSPPIAQRKEPQSGRNQLPHQTPVTQRGNQPVSRGGEPATNATAPSAKKPPGCPTTRGRQR